MSRTNWDETTDIIVIGSGSAGLSAALAARAGGAEVCILERSHMFGGTSAMSGGVAWIPNNHCMAEVGSSDTREAALTYLDSLSLGKTERVQLETFVDEGPSVIRFLEKATSLRFRALRLPDYHPEFPGGTFGRAIAPEAQGAKELGDLRPALRPSPQFPVPLSLLDTERLAAGEDPLASPVVVERIEQDIVVSGGALIAGMVKAALAQKISLRLKTRARSLFVDNGTVVGVGAEHDGKTLRFGARRGVILASGGFERNSALTKEFIRGPLIGPSGSPSNEGDGLLMAMEIGAALGNMTEAWWMPSLHIPGEEYDGQPFYRMTAVERWMPGSIIVNRQGRRFVNEAHNYNDIGRSFHSFDPVSFTYTNLPAWVIVHHGFLERYAFLTRFPGDPIPNWLTTAPSLSALAAKIGVDAAGLEETVKRFNANALLGKDPDFHRGESFYDRHLGDPSREGPLQTLGPLDEPPFYAMQVYPGALGTKGGPKTNERAEVLNVRGGLIPGLYAAGNVMAGVTGMAYAGAGGTIGPALVFGHIAGRNAAATSNRF